MFLAHRLNATLLEADSLYNPISEHVATTSERQSCLTLTDPHLTYQILGIFFNKTLNLNLLNTEISVLIFQTKRAIQSEIKATIFIKRMDCMKLLV